MSWRWRYATPNQRAGYLFGAGLLGLGLLGYTTGGGLVSEGTSLGPFRMNPLQGLVHTVGGALLLTAAAIGPGPSRVGNVLVGIVEGTVVALAVGLPADNILALDTIDAALLGPLALFLPAVATAPAFASRKDRIVPPGAISGAEARELGSGQARRLERLAAIPSGTVRPRAFEPAAATRLHDREPATATDEPEEATASDLAEEHTKKELYDMARELDVGGRSKMNKAQLAAALASLRRRPFGRAA